MNRKFDSNQSVKASSKMLCSDLIQKLSKLKSFTSFLQTKT